MIFLSKAEVLEIQRDSIETHGGTHGIRDEGAFESALMAAENRYFYEGADIIACAATYAFHLCQAHAFIDGNKRVGFGAAAIFLAFNDYELTGSDEELIDLFLRLAAGEISRDELETDFRARVKPSK